MAETITLIDLKGDFVELAFYGVYDTSRAGLAETWVYTAKDWLLQYPQIPIPIFTDWWVERLNETY